MTYLFIGYTVIWIAIFLYMLHVNRRLESVRRDVAVLADRHTGTGTR